MESHPVHRLPEFHQFLFDLLPPFHGGPVRFVLERLSFNLELDDAPFQGVDLCGHAVQFDPEVRGRLVDQVDGLVREKPVVDVTAGKGRGGDDGRVLDPDAVMNLVAFLQSPEDGNRILHRRLLDQDRLEPPLERRVFFDVLPVFVQSGRADAAQFAPRQGRLEHVRGVDGSLRRPGAHHRMDLINEEDDLPLGGGDLLQDSLQPLLELAAVLRPGDKGADIEADDPFVTEVLRHVPIHDPLCQSLDDCRLAHARFPDQDGVVLRPAGEDLHDPPDLFVPADHGVEGTAPGQLVKIACVTLERLVLLLRIGIGDALISADLHEYFEDRILRDVIRSEDLRERSCLFIGHRDKDMFRADILIRETSRFAQGGVKDTVQSRGHVGLAAGCALDLRQFLQSFTDLAFDPPGIGPEFSEDIGDNAILLFQKRDEEMLHIERLVAVLAGQTLRLLKRLLDLQCEFIESHREFPPVLGSRHSGCKLYTAGWDVKNGTASPRREKGRSERG